MLTSFPQTASSVRISRLPTRMLSQISRGEFVNFDILLTASTSGIADPPFTATVQQGSESSQAVCLAQQQRLKIHYFGTWLAAWNIYLTAYSHYHAYMTPQLLQYQTTITRFSQSYPVAAWRAYDMLFRQSRANDRTLRWDVVDETDVLRTFIQLGNTATTPSSLVTCYRCRHKGHMAAQCVANMGDNQGSIGRNNYNSIDNMYSHVRNNMVPRLGSNNYRNSMTPFRFPQRWGDRPTACHAYNAMGRCIRDCGRPRRCASCNGAHPRFSCYNNNYSNNNNHNSSNNNNNQQR